MPSTAAPTVSRLLLMSPDDNCLIARTPLAGGETLEIDGVAVVLAETIPLGYKVARHALQCGDKVLRYGALIGTVTQAVKPGGLLHTHNLASDYIPTYTLGPDARSFIGSTQ